MVELENEQPQPFKVTPGFIAFLGLLFLPVIVSLVIFLGAWAVSGEVRAAEAAADSAQPSSQSGFNTASEHDVAGWKRTLVGICPVH